MVRPDIKEFINTIPQDVTIVAASKYVDEKDIETLLDVGIKTANWSGDCMALPSARRFSASRCSTP